MVNSPGARPSAVPSVGLGLTLGLGLGLGDGVGLPLGLGLGLGIGPNLLAPVKNVSVAGESARATGDRR